MTAFAARLTRPVPLPVAPANLPVPPTIVWVISRNSGAFAPAAVEFTGRDHTDDALVNHKGVAVIECDRADLAVRSARVEGDALVRDVADFADRGAPARAAGNRAANLDERRVVVQRRGRHRGSREGQQYNHGGTRERKFQQLHRDPPLHCNSPVGVHRRPVRSRNAPRPRTEPTRPGRRRNDTARDLVRPVIRPRVRLEADVSSASDTRPLSAGPGEAPVEPSDRSQLPSASSFRMEEEHRRTIMESITTEDSPTPRSSMTRIGIVPNGSRPRLRRSFADRFRVRPRLPRVARRRGSGAMEAPHLGKRSGYHLGDCESSASGSRPAQVRMMEQQVGDRRRRRGDDDARSRRVRRCRLQAKQGVL